MSPAQTGPRRFAGRSVLVTGAAGGLGSADCLALAAEGAHLWAADIDLAAAEALVPALTEALRVRPGRTPGRRRPRLLAGAGRPGRAGRTAARPGQQRLRQPARGHRRHHRRRVAARHGHQPLQRLLRPQDPHPRPRPRRRGRRRRSRERLLRRRDGRLLLRHLRHQQMGRPRPVEGRRTRTRRARRPRQLAAPRPHLHPLLHQAPDTTFVDESLRSVPAGRLATPRRSHASSRSSSPTTPRTSRARKSSSTAD